MNIRKKTRKIYVGNIAIGGDAPIIVQSMTNTDTRDIEATLKQINQLHAVGCEIVRLAVPDANAAKALKAIHDASPLPLIADIHFDYRLALTALESGIEGLRINPGNIGERKKVVAVIDAAKAHKASIRIGVNSGSVEKHLIDKFGGPVPEAMVESALNHIKILEDENFYEIKVSIKSSSVLNTIAAYRMLSKSCDYPLHLGVTEAGSLIRGTVKSSVGLGILLSEGIGDTLRISLTEDPVEEVPVAWEILRALGLRRRGPEIIACPSCGRAEIDLIRLTKDVEACLVNEKTPLKIAVMGCVVNGPGEAKEADIGIAGGRDKGIIFAKGKVIRSVHGQDKLLNVFMEEVNKIIAEYNTAQ